MGRRGVRGRGSVLSFGIEGFWMELMLGILGVLISLDMG